MRDENEEYRRQVESYSLDDLGDVVHNMDREAYPARYEMAKEALARKQGLPAADLEAAHAAAITGIGGWLILPLLGLAISPFILIYGLITTFAAMMNFRTMAMMSDPSSPYHFPHLPLLLAFEMTYNLILLGLVVWTFWSFIRKKRRTPRLVIFIMAMGVVVQAGEYLLLETFARNFPGLGRETLIRALKAAASAAVWIPYFLKSERVANTFVE